MLLLAITGYANSANIPNKTMVLCMHQTVALHLLNYIQPIASPSAQSMRC
jgi:tRNA A37 threonylcarbamoyladenosine synthetase subunit TsaC/SUA5/YrdC